MYWPKIHVEVDTHLRPPLQVTFPIIENNITFTASPVLLTKRYGKLTYYVVIHNERKIPVIDCQYAQLHMTWQMKFVQSFAMLWIEGLAR